MHRMRSGSVIALGAVAATVAAVFLVVLALAGSGSIETVFATNPTATPTPTGSPTPTPKPGTTGNLSGVYDVLVHANAKATGLFHCIARIDQDGGTDVKATLVCYIDTPSLGPGSPLVDTANLVPGPVPPPPYTAAAPSKLAGSFSGGTLSLNGCFANLGGTLGPNVIVSTSFPNAKTDDDDGILSSTVDIFSNQSNADCTAGIPEAGDAPFINDQPINLYRASSGGGATPNPGAPWRGSLTDFDGDGCTDSDELAKVAPEACGDDPYNPNDSVTDFSGPVSISATAIRADWNTTTEALVPGSYFHCIGYTDHDTGDNSIATTVQCYTDSPAIGGASGSALPSAGDGLPGAPSPRAGERVATGFTSASPTVNTGSYSPGTGDITTTGCFADVGPPLGPNVLTVAVIDATTGQGTVQIFFSQTNAACLALTPLGKPAITGQLEVASQDTAQDSDGDGCTDSGEVLQDVPANKCGDDPYNPYDSDADFNGAYSLAFTAVPADIDGTEDTGGDSGGANSCYDGIDNGGGDGADGADPDDCNVIQGQYSHCIVDFVISAGTLTAPSMCYTDSSVLGTGGDGLPGSPPPFAPDTSPDSSYVNVNTTRRVISGTVSGNTITTVDCFENVDLPPTGPTNNVDVDTTASLNARTGHEDPPNSAVITFYPANSSCTGTPTPVFTTAQIDVAPQGPRYSAQPAPGLRSVDTDLDACRDEQELKATGTHQDGGVRDPYNRWDFFEQWTGLPLAKDRIVAVGDIGAVVGRFGANDTGPGTFTRTSDPNSTPNVAIVPSGSRANYHPSADRNGALAGNQWNLKPPDGITSIGDVGSVVAQFGHSCSGT
ncbi:MAG: flexitail domain-containing putative surface protein [Dehalococcoidia bacterium]